MTNTVQRALRSLPTAIAGGAAVLACTSYDVYTSLRGESDASATGGTRGASGAGGTTGSGGLGGLAGKQELDSGNGGALRDTSSENGGSSRDASSNTGGTSTDSSSDASISDGEAARDANASRADSLPPLVPTSDVVDGATLHPSTASSNCGFHRALLDGGHPELVVDFGCPDVMKDFQFVTPNPVVSVGVSPDGAIVPVVGDWEYVSIGNPHIAQLNNVEAYPTAGSQAVLEGTKALYTPVVFRNGKVSVRTWSTDNDSACLIARHQNVVNYYRFCINTASGAWVLLRIHQAAVTELERGSIRAASTYAPGRVLGLEFIGQTIRPYIDDKPVGQPVEDPGGFTFGLVGMEAIVLQDSYFDDLTIVTYEGSASTPAGTVDGSDNG